MSLRMCSLRSKSFANRKCFFPLIRQTASFKKNSNGRGDTDTPDNKDITTDLPKGTEDLLDAATTRPQEYPKPEFPSDETDDYWAQWDTYDQYKTSQRRHSYRSDVDPKETSILLFPGQGSQFVGMGKKLLHYPNVPEMYQVASQILGYDLLDLCLNGPKSELNKTKYCQPALLVTSLAAVEKLKVKNPKAIENCISATGFSVGEISALVFAGSLSFEQGVKLVQKRGEAMQRASEKAPGGMMTVLLRHDHKIRFACLTARTFCEERKGIQNPVCSVANHLYENCKVIAGHEEALSFIENTKEEFGLHKCTRLPVSGAFHTELMRPAALTVRNYLKEQSAKKPSIPVHSNFTAKAFNRFSDEIKKSLVTQIFKPVKWEQIMHILYEREKGKEFPNTFEVGPGRQLGVLLQKNCKPAFKFYDSIEV